MNWLIEEVFLQDPPSGFGRQSHQLCKIWNRLFGREIPSEIKNDFQKVKEFTDKLSVLPPNLDRNNQILYNNMLIIIEKAKDSSEEVLLLLTIAVLGGSNSGHFDSNIYVYKVAAQILDMSRSSKRRDKTLAASIIQHTEFNSVELELVHEAHKIGKFPSASVKYIFDIVLDLDETGRIHLEDNYPLKFTKNEKSADALFYRNVMGPLVKVHILIVTRLFSLSIIFRVIQKGQEGIEDLKKIRESVIESLEKHGLLVSDKKFDEDSITAYISELFPELAPKKSFFGIRRFRPHIQP